MTSTSCNYHICKRYKKQISGLIVILVALFGSTSPLPAAGENPVLQAQKAVKALEKVQWANQEFIESFQRVHTPSGDGGFSGADKRANEIHILKANQKAEREKLAELKVLYQTLINGQQTDSGPRSQKRIHTVDRDIAAKLDELAESQEAAEGLMRKLAPDREPPDAKKARELFREAVREVSRLAAREAALAAARAAAREPIHHRTHPHLSESHHHSHGGRN